MAHDARRTGPAYLTIAVDAFRAAGLDVVYLPGVCSTSYFYYAAMRHPRHAAVMVGASHNPPVTRGQKILGPGVRPIAQGIGQGGSIASRSCTSPALRPPAALRGDLQAKELIDDYVAYSMELAGVAPGSLQGRGSSRTTSSGPRAAR